MAALQHRAVESPAADSVMGFLAVVVDYQRPSESPGLDVGGSAGVDPKVRPL
jgi:hypothetical protein